MIPRDLVLGAAVGALAVLATYYTAALLERPELWRPDPLAALAVAAWLATVLPPAAQEPPGAARPRARRVPLDPPRREAPQPLQGRGGSP